jgi:hypothetical protein
MPLRATVTKLGSRVGSSTSTASARAASAWISGVLPGEPISSSLLQMKVMLP